MTAAESIRVRARGPLVGHVRVAGMTKNAGCKQLAATLLASGVSRIANVHPVLDLDVMIELLRTMGADVEWCGADALRVDTTGPLEPQAPYDLVTRMRASVNVLGPLLARHGRARVAMPGGDNIGTRKLDMHFRGLRSMGAELTVRHGYIEATANALAGAHIVLEFPSVGATEMLLTTAVLAKGETLIENAAREPEIADLAAFLAKMGAQVEGAGTSTIVVEGVDELSPAEHTILGDRIEAGTFAFAVAAARGDVTIEGVEFAHLGILGTKLADMGMIVERVPEGVRVLAERRLRSVDVQTLPFPGFATDYMPMAVAALATADGTSIVTENVFDNRLSFVAELNRMGADIRTEGRHAVVRGVPRLSGAPVRALDVRAGAALMVAGLAAEGETSIFEPAHIARGYADLPGKLAALGAEVELVPERSGPAGR